MSWADDTIQLQGAVLHQAHRGKLTKPRCNLYQQQHRYLYGKSGDGLGQLLLLLFAEKSEACLWQVGRVIRPWAPGACQGCPRGLFEHQGRKNITVGKLVGNPPQPAVPVDSRRRIHNAGCWCIVFDVLQEEVAEFCSDVEEMLLVMLVSLQGLTGLH